VEVASKGKKLLTPTLAIYIAVVKSHSPQIEARQTRGRRTVKHEKGTWARFARRPKTHQAASFASATAKNIEGFNIHALETEGGAFSPKSINRTPEH
jgi:hypothetical protein